MHIDYTADCTLVLTPRERDLRSSAFLFAPVRCLVREACVQSDEFAYDPAVNAAYLALTRGEVAESLPVTNRSGDVLLVVDVAADGRVIGIEFLDAARQLPGWIDP